MNKIFGWILIIIVILINIILIFSSIKNVIYSENSLPFILGGVFVDLIFLFLIGFLPLRYLFKQLKKG